MLISRSNSQVGFCAKLNDNTRKLIKEADKHYKSKLEKKFDKAINASALKNFGGDDTTISLGIYRSSDGWESTDFYAPVVNTKIQGMDVSVALPSFGHPNFSRQESTIVNNLAYYSHYQDSVLRSIQNADISDLKQMLAQKYIQQYSQQMKEQATAETYDNLVSEKIKFPQI